MTGSGIGEIALSAEVEMVRELGLGTLALPAELARLDGSFRGEPVALESRAYRGERSAYFRFVRIEGQSLQIANLLCFSTPEHALPILGVDLVALGTGTLVLAADLSPIHPDPHVRRAQLSGLARRSPGSDLARSEPPAWCEPWFSPHAVVARATPAELPAVAAALSDFVRAYIELARTSEPAPALAREVAEAQRAYSRAHLEHDRGLGLLRKLFEPAVADRFLHEVLFPTGGPAWN